MSKLIIVKPKIVYHAIMHIIIQENYAARIICDGFRRKKAEHNFATSSVHIRFCLDIFFIAGFHHEAGILFSFLQLLLRKFTSTIIKWRFSLSRNYAIFLVFRFNFIQQHFVFSSKFECSMKMNDSVYLLVWNINRISQTKWLTPSIVQNPTAERFVLTHVAAQMSIEHLFPFVFVRSRESGLISVW